MRPVVNEIPAILFAGLFAAPLLLHTLAKILT